LLARPCYQLDSYCNGYSVWIWFVKRDWLCPDSRFISILNLVMIHLKLMISFKYQSSLFAQFAITNYHWCRFYYDYDQSQIDLVTIWYELILAHVWANLPVVWIAWCHDNYNNFKTILFRSDHISCCCKNTTFACDLFGYIAFKLDMKWFSKLFNFDFVYPIYDNNQNRVCLFLYSVIGFWFYSILNDITFSNEMIPFQMTVGW